MPSSSPELPFTYAKHVSQTNEQKKQRIKETKSKPLSSSSTKRKIKVRARKRVT